MVPLIAGSFLTSAAGSGSSSINDLRDDIKFAELAAKTLSNLRQTRQLQRNQASLSSFFSPVVLESLSGKDPEELFAPKEILATILFCDLRGFSRRSEQASEDLLGLLERVSLALGFATKHILEHGGVVGDFHGDAVMGFWGWPLPQEEITLAAAKAALAIRQEFAAVSAQTDHPLSGFRMGLGIATGNAVAGKIGTIDQAKVTVFGPVVNLASRLEGMTKILKAPIMIDQTTAQILAADLSPDIGRLRKLAVVQPYGLSQAVEVTELLPSAAQFPELTDEAIGHYEAALAALLEKDWQTAFERLHQIPAADRVKDFLTVYIAQHNRSAPEDWNGVIPLSTK